MSAKAQAINMPQTADLDASERGSGKIELLTLYCLVNSSPLAATWKVITAELGLSPDLKEGETDGVWKTEFEEGG